MSRFTLAICSVMLLAGAEVSAADHARSGNVVRGASLSISSSATWSAASAAPNRKLRSGRARKSASLEAPVPRSPRARKTSKRSPSAAARKAPAAKRKK